MNEQQTADLWRLTFCILCYVNCGLEVATEGRTITRVRGDCANTRSHGYLCQKPQRLQWYGDHADRLTTPLRRRPDGTHEPISWETAFTEIAARLNALRAEHGGEAFAVYGGGGQGNHLGGTGFLALRDALGATKYFNALSQEKTGDFWVNGRLFGDQFCHTAEDVEHTDLLVVLGCNPWMSNGFQGARNEVNEIKKTPGRRMIVIDPRRTEVADLADIHLPLRPGTDAFLLAAILAIILQRGGEAAEFLSRHTVGWEEVRTVLARTPIVAWVAHAGVPLAAVERTVDMILAAQSMVVRAELGIQQSRHSTLNSYLEKLLYLVTENFGRRGTNGIHTWLARLDPAEEKRDPAYPFTLVAGQRRMHNANQIFRTPAWRKTDLDGALRIHPNDLAALGGTDGGWMAVTTRTGRLVCRVESDPSMRPGLVALPHGYGQSYPDGSGGRIVDGPRLNLITAHDDCDPIAATPYHKNVTVHLVPVVGMEAEAAEAASARVRAVAAAHVSAA